jgi:hypothetical protein
VAGDAGYADTAKVDHAATVYIFVKGAASGRIGMMHVDVGS